MINHQTRLCRFVLERTRNYKIEQRKRKFDKKLNFIDFYLFCIIIIIFILIYTHIYMYILMIKTAHGLVLLWHAAFAVCNAVARSRVRLVKMVFRSCAQELYAIVGITVHIFIIQHIYIYGIYMQIYMWRIFVNVLHTYLFIRVG